MKLYTKMKNLPDKSKKIRDIKLQYFIQWILIKSNTYLQI